MCTARSRFASSIKGLFSASESSFHSAPSRFEISELCILGFSCAIFLRCPLDHTMKAFIGRFTRSAVEEFDVTEELFEELLFVPPVDVLLLLLLLDPLLLLLLLLLVLLLFGGGTCVCGGEWVFILATEPTKGGGEFKEEDKDVLREVREEWVEW